MKKIFACLTVLVVSIMAATGVLLQEESTCSTQSMLHGIVSVPDNGNFVVQASDNVIPYAENRSITRHLTNTNYSPRSNFPTSIIGAGLPLPVSFGKGILLRSAGIPVKPRLSLARLYVLRV